MTCTKHDNCRAVPHRVRAWMAENAADYRDIQAGEPNYTALAEIAAWEFDHDEWLDDPDHGVWEWALSAFAEDDE